MKKIVSVLVCACLLSFIITGCKSTPAKDQLSPKTPVTVELWHYYNGQTKSVFDALVTEFNNTIGEQKGVVVSASSQGDVNDLANAVLASATKEIGAEEMPHLFAAYSDNVFRIEQLGLIASVNDYFTKEELSEYRQDFLAEGVFGKTSTLKILPIAKSTENLFINKTDWDKFVAETNANIKDLSTWEGITKTAALYYDWSDKKTQMPNDGKAFTGIDSMANFMLLSVVQNGESIVTVKDEKPTFTLSTKAAQKIWDNFYLPYISGHYAAIARFRSDDAKTGDIISYVGSTAGSVYFPRMITMGKDKEYPIECMILPYPYYEGTDPFAVQQGAGMAIVKSDKQHEQAAATFLKWFTDTEQNLKFSAPTGYLPVKNEALNYDLIKAKIDANIDANANPAVQASTKTTVEMLSTHTLFGIAPYQGSFDVRTVCEKSLLAIANADLEEVKLGIKLGGDKGTVISKLNTPARFDEWYTSLQQEITAIISPQ